MVVSALFCESAMGADVLPAFPLFVSAFVTSLYLFLLEMDVTESEGESDLLPAEANDGQEDPCRCRLFCVKMHVRVSE